jgi:uncharacterized membrane protein required for colicin V production
MNAAAANFNWFDGIVLALLVVGCLRGRKRGMSEELLSLCQWLAIVVVSSLYCEWFSGQFLRIAGMPPTWAKLIAYSLILVGNILAIALLKKAVGEKLVGSDLFGRLEYYLGILAGMTRYACMIIAFMAVMNIPYYSPQEIAATRKENKDIYGNVNLPSFMETQIDILHQSYTSKLVKENLGTLLIKPAYSSEPVKKIENIGKRSEREINRIMEGK